MSQTITSKRKTTVLLWNASVGVFAHPNDIENVILPLRQRNMLGHILAGLYTGGLSVPNVYRTSVVTQDKVVVHHADVRGVLSERQPYQGEKLCHSFHVYLSTPSISPEPCHRMYVVELLCEVTSIHDGHYNRSPVIINFPSLSPVVEGLKTGLTRCPSGHLIHTFLPCSGNNTSTLWFLCDDEVTRVYYTLVCDFRQDCHDGSDESFCQHPPCDGFTCNSKQCIPYRKYCNIVSDCIDDSDESDCLQYYEYTIKSRNLPSPIIVRFDGENSFSKARMGYNELCPDTHYRCPGKYNDCLPVFTRCNGWYDCVDHEDEDNCEKMTCPGFYRCLHSTVCVHTDHLCDSWSHCPQYGDDEWFCDMTCPSQCLCQGHAFVCPKHSTVSHFLHLSYLDAEGSGMTLSDLHNNPYIIHLNLRLCSLTSLSLTKLLNLQILDLSRNKLKFVNMDVFVVLKNLRWLSLAENPLSLLTRPSSSDQQTALRTVDLSNMKLSAFNCDNVSNFYNLQNLNLSFNTLHTFQSDSFQCMPRLVQLHARGNPVKEFPGDLFQSMSHLRVVSTDNYRLCCSQILPAQSYLVTCDAPKDDISSCEDLLQSRLYRVFLWLVSVMSLLGNVFCLAMRVCVQRGVSVSGFHVFVFNLSMADLLMGVYLAIIGVADELFRGKYLLYDETWKHSIACKVEGFLSLLSSEVSALTIWFITLDRFIVLRFPFGRVRFQRASAAAVCLTTWFIGFLLAVTPLLPVTSHWEFYSQTGICIPLPVTRRDFKGKVYSVSILIVLNFILFILIATGQAFIYWSVQKNSMKSDTTKMSRDLTMARRLISVAMTDFLCWFPIGLCGLLASVDTPISGEVNVALAIFVLPLNSALNPFMYTVNTVMEKRRKSKEALLLQWLEKHANLLDKL